MKIFRTIPQFHCRKSAVFRPKFSALSLILQKKIGRKSDKVRTKLFKISDEIVQIFGRNRSNFRTKCHFFIGRKTGLFGRNTNVLKKSDQIAHFSDEKFLKWNFGRNTMHSKNLFLDSLVRIYNATKMFLGSLIWNNFWKSLILGSFFEKETVKLNHEPVVSLPTSVINS